MWIASRVSVGLRPDKRTPNEIAVVELFDRICKSGTRSGTARCVKGVPAHSDPGSLQTASNRTLSVRMKRTLRRMEAEEESAGMYGARRIPGST